jgi:bilirubin oxidase
LQELWIPPVIEGKKFDLTLAPSSRKFLEGTTNTYGYNGLSFWGPTLILNQGETVTLNVKNGLKEATTVHWHGLHLPAATDGGPHQIVAAGKTWSPSFVVKNNAGTYWYHPHLHELTQKQLAMGAGGLIIIRDPAEAKLALPRTYGVDDLPLVLTSRRFKDNQFTYDGDNDKYGDYQLTNGTLDAQTKLPRQLVRLRILNAEIERGYVLGFGDNRTFYQIATDGGLVDKPVPLTRLTLMVGERTEILVDLGADKVGGTVDLMAYNSNQTFGFPGGEPDTGGANGSYLNNYDYRLLRINVVASTAKPVTKVPEALTRNVFVSEKEASAKRTISVTDGRPHFAFDGKPFDMHTTNMVVKLGATEVWTVKNNNIFGHSFHLHDVQFRILSRTDREVAAYEKGWKDTFYLPRGASVTFVAKFDDYASDTDPFMFHCHMSNHEDGGMMGQFIVSKDPAAVKRDAKGLINFRAQTKHPLPAAEVAATAAQAARPAAAFAQASTDGRRLDLAALAKAKPVVLFFIEKDCPCSRDAAPCLAQLQAAYGEACAVVGVINADEAGAKEWVAKVRPGFPVVPDPSLAVIDAYGAKRSVYVTVVAPGGSIAKAYPGYNADSLTEISATVARLARVPVQALAWKDAPGEMLAGCPLRE